MQAMSAEHEGMDLRLLGPVRVWRDDAEVRLGSARHTAVLCVLALSAGHAVSREQLVAAVWGEDAPASATGNVYTYVSTLRRLLEPARGRWAAGRLLTSGGSTYQLHLPPESVDVFRFESLRDAARRHRAAGDAAAELATVESALRLWDGDALAGVPGPFAEAQRLRLAEFRLATAERHATLLAEAGRPEAAAVVLRGLVRAHPLKESLRAMLADALRAAGRGGGTPAAAGPGRPALIGRHAEIRRLRRAVAEAALGCGRSVRVEGAPGIGKSALLAEALHGAVPAPCRTGWAAGDELAQRPPLGLLLECLESATAGVADELAAVAAGVADELAALAAGAGDDIRAETVELAADLICRAAEEAPLILVADDLQWADPLTLRVWHALGERAARVPLLLVAAVRSGSPEACGLPADEVVELGPLAADEATALVRAVAPERPETTDLGRILDDAGGNPHYLRHLAGGETGRGGLTAAIGTHLTSFTDQTRQVLRAAAFLSAYELAAPGAQPPGCTMAALAAVTGSTGDDLARQLEAALAAGVLTRAGDRLAFRHRIVARTLHEGVPAALRITLHRTFADRIAAAGGPPEQGVAQLLAGDVPLDDGVGAWLIEHVEQVAARAPRTAVAVLRRARAQSTLDPAQRLSLNVWLARLLLRQDDNAAAEAGWVAARTTDPELEGEMRWIAAHVQERRGEFEAAADIAHAALRERRIAPQWMDRLRALVTRIRPNLPGNPTAPHLTRSALVDGEVPVLR